MAGNIDIPKQLYLGLKSELAAHMLEIEWERSRYNLSYLMVPDGHGCEVYSEEAQELFDDHFLNVGDILKNNNIVQGD